MRVVLLVLLLTLSSAVPAAAAPNGVDDRTAALLADLDRCAPQVGRPAQPLPFSVLLALADGRSAREFAALVSSRGCVGIARPYGDGADETVLIGYTGPPPLLGAVLWVDQGWWRIASAPIGHVADLIADQTDGGARELFVGVGSGGSAGDIGVVGIRLRGSAANTFLQTPMSSSQTGAILVDPDHLVVSGRHLPDRPFAWSANCCLPGGYEWLYARRGSAFVPIAERQVVDPYFALSAFIGGVYRRDPAQFGDVGTDVAAASLLAVPGLRPEMVATPQAAPAFWELGRDELLTWDAIPLASRSAAPVGPVYASSYLLDDAHHPAWDLVFQLDRLAAGWRVTSVFASDRIVRSGRGPS